jgi:aryl-alcohol dehydrogenase-like predicted oxidoreductase
MAHAAEQAGPMPLRKLGRTGFQVSAITLGGYHAGMPEGEDISTRIIHRAMDLGINFFDNADCYQEGGSERRMGKALAEGGRRHKIILMSKVDQRDAAGARDQLEKSLRNLRTDYLDLWQFHAVGNLEELDQIFGPKGALETAEKARKEGLIRFIGLTGHFDPAVHFEAIKRYPFAAIQMPINVVDPHFRSFRKKVLDEAVKRGIGIIAMKTLAEGKILSKKVATVAEAMPWVWSQPVSTICSGCDSVEVLENNVYLCKTFKSMTMTEQ